MSFRLLLGFSLVFVAIPAWAEESLLDVVLKRDKLIVATYSTSTAPLTKSRPAINVVAACKHAAFREVFASLVTRRDLRLPQPERGLIHRGLVMHDEDCSTVYRPEDWGPTCHRAAIFHERSLRSF
jgi:hypothetical protein